MVFPRRVYLLNGPYLIKTYEIHKVYPKFKAKLAIVFFRGQPNIYWGVVSPNDAMYMIVRTILSCETLEKMFGCCPVC